jgi:flavin reductase (DIM6/NTAB) family NADH-FMN oxidoreductase RutF
MGHFCSGIAVVTSAAADLTFGISVQSFTSLSLDPPLVSIAPARTSRSWPLIRQTGQFCVSILGSDQEQLSRQFAVSGSDKFAGVSWNETPAGLPWISGALAWVDCTIYAEYAAGDHSIVIGRVRDLGVNATAAARPLLYFRGRYAGLEK